MIENFQGIFKHSQRKLTTLAYTDIAKFKETNFACTNNFCHAILNNVISTMEFREREKKMIYWMRNIKICICQYAKCPNNSPISDNNCHIQILDEKYQNVYMTIC